MRTQRKKERAGRKIGKKKKRYRVFIFSSFMPDSCSLET